jgi:hypothetical protein
MTPRPRHGRPPFPALPLLALLLLTALGCMAEEIQSDYGRRNPRSINGVSAFARLFRQAGCNVASTRSFSDRVKQNADVIVWFPETMQAPTDAERAWLEAWLTTQPGRTLIDVHPDFDAEPAYWRAVAAQPGSAYEVAECLARASLADSGFLSRRASTPETTSWFSYDPTSKPAAAANLDGDPYWTSGIDATKLDVHLVGRIDPGPDAVAVLMSGPDCLIVGEPWSGSSRSSSPTAPSSSTASS